MAPRLATKRTKTCGSAHCRFRIRPRSQLRIELRNRARMKRRSRSHINHHHRWGRKLVSNLSRHPDMLPKGRPLSRCSAATRISPHPPLPTHLHSSLRHIHRSKLIHSLTRCLSLPSQPFPIRSIGSRKRPTAAMVRHKISDIRLRCHPDLELLTTPKLCLVMGRETAPTLPRANPLAKISLAGQIRRSGPLAPVPHHPAASGHNQPSRPLRPTILTLQNLVYNERWTQSARRCHWCRGCCRS